MKIYLAGKIGKHDWRHSIVKGLGTIEGIRFQTHEETGGHGGSIGDWPVLERAVFGVHDYVGPFFSSPVNYTKRTAQINMGWLAMRITWDRLEATVRHSMIG